MTPVVSIIVPSYNGARYLPALCRSFQAQTFGDFEVLIGDDGSTDNTHEVLAPFLRDARFRLISWQPNAGQTAAVLTLLDQVRGEFWVGIAHDDELKPEFLERRLALLRRHPQVSLVHGPPELIDEESRPLAPDGEHRERIAANASLYSAIGHRLAPVLSSVDALRLLLTHNLISAPTIMVRTAVTRRLLPRLTLNWRFAQDWFLWLMHVSTGNRLAYDPEPLARYRLHGESMSFDPRKHAIRKSEMRLIPLCALGLAAELSYESASLWAERRKTLYALWLKTAIGLRRSGQLDDSWMQMGAAAFYGRGKSRVSLWSEVARHSWSIACAAARDHAARRRQWFSVSGLAELEVPFFRRGAE